MPSHETEVEIANQHVRQGREYIARQLEIILRLRAKGLPTEEAERLLDRFEELQRSHEAHLERLQNSR